MNPIFSIWAHPTETLKYMRAKNSMGYSLLIFLLASISVGMVSMMNSGIFTGMPIVLIVLISIVISFVGAIIGWFISTALYTWVGKWLGGRGRFSDMLNVTPASSILQIWLSPMNLALLVLYGSTLFEAPASEFEVTNIPLGVFFLVNLVNLAVGIYGIVITSKGIGLVHGFSAWRGFGAVAIITGILIVIGIILVLIFGAIIFAIVTAAF